MLNEFNKFKYGEDNLDSIMFSSTSGDVRNHFDTFKINPNAEVEVLDDGFTIIIKKFPANTWLIHSQETDTTYGNIRKQMTNWYVDIEGIEALVNDGTITFRVNVNNTDREGEKYNAIGISFQPLRDNGVNPFVYWWDLGISDGKLKNPNHGSRGFGYVKDGINNVFNIGPSDDLSKPFQSGIIIYTGSYKDREIVDISDRPIKITQIYDYYLPDSIEAWDIYCGKDYVYHKDKTLNNCWLKYKYAHQMSYTHRDSPTPYTLTIVDNDGMNNGSIILPRIIDLDNVVFTEKTWAIWRCKIKNIEFWEEIRKIFNSHVFTPGEAVVKLESKLFSDSNFSGNLKVNIKNDSQKGTYYMVFRNAFRDTQIESIDFNFENCVVGSAQNLFLGARNLSKITTNIPFLGRDCSGLFEFCGNLKEYPSNLINWGERIIHENDTIPSTYINFAFEYSGLKEIPSYNTSNRFADDNTIVSIGTIQQAFKYCNNLTKIGPVIDCILVDPMNGTNAWDAFLSSNIVDARIKRLNHGNWRLDGSYESKNEYTRNGNLPNLNKESVIYLFENLYDLVKNYVEKPEKPNSLISKRNHASLYCPEKWRDKITKDMVTSANAKGWTIYIGGKVYVETPPSPPEKTTEEKPIENTDDSKIGNQEIKQ